MDDRSELTRNLNSDADETQNDQIPNYIDLDSDDDGCFDVAEA